MDVPKYQIPTIFHRDGMHCITVSSDPRFSYLMSEDQPTIFLFDSSEYIGVRNSASPYLPNLFVFNYELYKANDTIGDCLRRQEENEILAMLGLEEPLPKWEPDT